jgi:SAM-dependent methyltransferase
MINKKYKKIIDLGMHPFADTFIAEDQIHMSEPVYPLSCLLDSKTGEIKLLVDTSADERYNLYNYSYTSSNSKFSRNHWIEYCEKVSKKVNLKKNSKIVEIGSNDGFLSKQFINLGHSVVGVDPSSFMCNLAESLGVKTFNVFFNRISSELIKESFGKADLIIANNVFNHANNTIDFLKGVKNLLNPDGTFVFELPYFYNTIKDKKFDQIYHEHVTYFTAKYSYNLFKSAGMAITDIELVDYHGGSIRVYGKISKDIKMIKKVENLIKKEEDFGLFDPSMYKSFMKNIIDERNSFMKKIYDLKSEGYPIVGVGAAAKANTFLNFYNIDNTILDYVSDSSVYKQKKYTPLTRIPIVGDEIFDNYGDVYALILSWNISDSLVENLKKINKRIKFLFPYN